ncbi:MAG: DNA translocase FtsK 4TM domain-containing protein [Armatimonadota bacterium]
MARASEDTHKLRRDVAAIALITAAVLTFASLLYASQGGPAEGGGYLPGLLSTALTLSFGIGAFAVPVILFAIGILFALERPQFASSRALTGAGLIFLVVLTATAMHVPEQSRFDPEWVAINGGYIGAAAAHLTLTVLGLVGSYIVLTGLAIIALVMITQTSVQQLIRGSARVFTSILGFGWRVVADGVSDAREVAASAAADRKKKSNSRSRKARPMRPDRGPVVELDLEADRADQQDAPKNSPAPATPASTPQEAPRKKPRGSSSSSKGGKNSDDGQTALLQDSDLYSIPSMSILSELKDEDVGEAAAEEATENIIKLEDTLESFGVEAKVVAYERGPVITRYEVEPGSGIRVGKIVNLSDDLAMALAAVDVRVEAPIPGKSAVGIEVPNQHRAVVSLRGLLEESEVQNHPSPLAVALGRDIAGHAVVADLYRMPHLLVAGATNSGKSVCLHSIIVSILMRVRPDQVKFILIDPKRVELRLYEGIPHLMSPVVYSPKEAADALRKVIREMDKRYDQFAMKGVVNIEEYNQVAAEEKEHRDQEFDPMPHVVIVVDELADLMMQSKAEFEFSICRLAQLARATGIHLVLATQRPSVNVITGTIKANIPSRIALSVTSQHDSRTILDGQGAERLIGRGDMLYSPIDDNQARRLQGAFIPRSDLQRLVEYLCAQGEPDFDIIPQTPDDDEGDFAAEIDVSDKLYEAAVEYVVGETEASVSGLQRRFKIGYARAGRIMDAMEQRGVVGPHVGPKPREVLLNPGAMHAHLSGGEYTHPSEIEMDEPEPEKQRGEALRDGAEREGDGEETEEIEQAEELDDLDETEAEIAEEEAAAESA